MIFMALSLLTLSAHAGEVSRRTVSILFTHDLHSQILPHASIADDGTVRETGGFARLATAITRERSRRPSSTIVVDAGDYSMGTLFHTLVMDRAVELRMLGLMGYDAGTFGNHDLDFRWDGVVRSLHAARTSGDRIIPLLASNMNVPAGEPSLDPLREELAAYGVRDRMVLERNGLRIGLFALMGSDAARDCPFLGSVTFDDCVSSAGRMVALLREQEHVDLVVCLSHSGTSPNRSRSEDVRLAEQVPGIDVIVSGHTHRTFTEPLRIGSTVIVSAGPNCANLGVLDLIVGAGGVSVSGYRLVPLDPSIPDDRAVAERATGFVTEIDSAYLRRHGLSFHQVIARSPFAFESVAYGYARGGELRLGDLITDAFAYAVRRAEGPDARPVDVVIQPLGMIRHTLGPGPITVDDAFRVLSLGRGPDGEAGYPLVAPYVTGEDLLTILEVGPTLAAVKGDVHLQYRGVRFAVNPHRLPLNRVTRAELVDDNGRVREIHPDSLYRVCVNYYTAFMIEMLGDLSYGVVRVQPRNADGTPVAMHETVMIDGDVATPGVQEVKEWIALVSYLRSFPPGGAGGIPEVPAAYRTLRGWYAWEPSWNPLMIMRGPNSFALRAAGGVIVLVGIVVLITLVVRPGRRRPPSSSAKG
ncbi:MAG: bifunctional metallophosphatase/5'-nucleotidase [Ignavibacteriae bacterium]|nr:bifunctional metallophosphatase/5'-nucleotidase [Ignavibacteriota bacterium]